MLVESQKLASVELSDRQSAQLLAQLRPNDSHVLVAPNADTAGIAASVAEVTDEAIELAILRNANVVKAIQSSEFCHVSFTVDEEHYCFDAGVILVDCVEGAARLRVQKPKRVSLRRRRRYRRTTVRESTTVDIQANNGATKITGAMLNVSAAGLACLVDQCDAGPLCAEGAVQARFRLDGDDHAYSIETELKAVTPASDSARVILRLEFRWKGNTDARDRLDRATRPPMGTE